MEDGRPARAGGAESLKSRADGLKLEIEIGGEARRVELTRAGGRVRCSVDGRELQADAVEVAPGVYSILMGGESLEARVEVLGPGLRVSVGDRDYRATVRDPRQWRRRGGGALEAEGRQQVLRRCREKSSVC